MTVDDAALDTYIVAHERIHAALTVAMHDHESLPAHTSLEPRVRALEDYALQTKTFALMLKLVFGTSVIGAIAGLITLFTLVEHLVGG